MTTHNKPAGAGFFRILGSIFYDALLLFAVLFFAHIVLLLIPDNMQRNPLIEAGKILWYLMVSYFYFVGFWSKGRKTPGMKTWKLELLDNAGSIPNRKQLSLRFFSALLSWLLFGMGFVWILFDRNHRSLHDHLSGTYLSYSA
jgi:uncharacterized RDD family membrane protein YckC